MKVSMRVVVRQVGRGQLDSKTERSLCCHLAKETWRMKCNYNKLQLLQLQLQSHRENLCY